MYFKKVERETIINFNAGEKYATVYTRDKTIMKKFDALVTEYPEIYKCLSETDTDKTYQMPKSYVNYRKPRKISETKREQARSQMHQINRSK